ncbi:MAG: sigma-70 family RNA polymerase sigma factor, partial [Solirubrobacterales bacterium]
MTDLIDALWARYRQNGDPQARTQLLDRFLGLVHHSAHQLARRISRDVEIDDLIGAGTLGLVQALEGFEPARGLAFSTYAMPRIRGSMLDELRTRDWMPRSVRMRSRQLQAARAALQHKFGRQPSHEEVSQALGIDLETYWHWQEEVDGRVLLQLDATGSDDDEHAPRLAERIADVLAGDPGDALDDMETVARLRDAFGRLSARDRLVLTLYYYEELNLRQIGEVMH